MCKNPQQSVSLPHLEGELAVASSYFTSSDCQVLCSGYRCYHYTGELWSHEDDVTLWDILLIFLFKNKQTVKKNPQYYLHNVFKITWSSQSIVNVLLCVIFSQSTCMTLLWWEIYLKVTHCYCNRNWGSVWWKQPVVKTSYICAVKGVHPAGPRVRRCVQREVGRESLISPFNLLQNYLLPSLLPWCCLWC